MAQPSERDTQAQIVPDEQAAVAFGRFVGIIARLRAPDGCPWDRKQTHASIARNLIEEAYEAVAAIEDGDAEELAEELGDVLLEVVLQAQIASDAGEFTINDVLAAIDAKMIRRHPHVFGTRAASQALGVDLGEVTTAEQVAGLWDRIKLIEREQAEERRRAKALAAGEDPDVEPGLLDGVPRSQPALMQTQGIVRKAAAAGFFWDSEQGIWDKVAEEAAEFREALAKPEPGRAAGTEQVSHATEEFGDLLFSLVCVAHQEGVDAETALQVANAKFRRRWAIIEEGARQQGRRVEDLTLAEQDALWDAAKAAGA